MTGKIKILKTGYGFIVPKDGSEDVFFHLKNLQKGLEFNSLREGDILCFDIEDSPKGLNAINISQQNEMSKTNL